MTAYPDRNGLDAVHRASRHVVIVIVGGGFGGLACAMELGNAPDNDVTVVDRRNHNLFQPLLYQVATAALSPADIAEPIRKTLARFKNINMIMAEVVGLTRGCTRCHFLMATRFPTTSSSSPPAPITTISAMMNGGSSRPG
ncbi:UNVERIFIED_ORG: choline dehydrogenase-like flavoprotein [Rhizobium etli]